MDVGRKKFILKELNKLFVKMERIRKASKTLEEKSAFREALLTSLQRQDHFTIKYI